MVVVHGDGVLATYKKGRPILAMEERINSVAGCRYVGEVLPNVPFVIDRAWIEEHDIRVVVHGDDLSQQQLDYFYKVPIEIGIFRTVPYTPGAPCYGLGVLAWVRCILLPFMDKGSKWISRLPIGLR